MKRVRGRTPQRGNPKRRKHSGGRPAQTQHDLHDDTFSDLHEDLFDSGVQAQDDEDVNSADIPDYVEDEDDNKETPEEKRVRLAKEFLDKMRQTDDQPDRDDEDEDDDEELQDQIDPQDELHQRLHSELLRAKGKLEEEVSSGVLPNPEVVAQVKGFRLPPTSVFMANDESLILAAGKDGRAFVVDTETSKKIARFEESHAIYSISADASNNLVAFGGDEKLVKVFDLRQKNQLVSNPKFGKHARRVTGVRFREVSGQPLELITSSDDRLLKMWNGHTYGFIEALYGHEAGVCSLDILNAKQDIALSSGLDGTVRYWKIAEESQLVFPHGSTANPVDCCCFITDSRFVSGSQDGSLALWTRSKRKPSSIRQGVHSGKWISAVAARPYTNVLASGSSNGIVKIWESSNGLKPLVDIPMEGFVNEMKFSASGKFLACAVGREHKFGRWSTVPSAQNNISILKISE